MHHCHPSLYSTNTACWLRLGWYYCLVSPQIDENLLSWWPLALQNSIRRIFQQPSIKWVSMIWDSNGCSRQGSAFPLGSVKCWPLSMMMAGELPCMSSLMMLNTSSGRSLNITSGAWILCTNSLGCSGGKSFIGIRNALLITLARTMLLVGAPVDYSQYEF